MYITTKIKKKTRDKVYDMTGCYPQTLTIYTINFLYLFKVPYWIYPYLKEASKNKNDVPQNEDTPEI